MRFVLLTDLTVLRIQLLMSIQNHETLLQVLFAYLLNTHLVVGNNHIAVDKNHIASPYLSYLDIHLLRPFRSLLLHVQYAWLYVHPIFDLPFNLYFIITYTHVIQSSIQSIHDVFLRHDGELRNRFDYNRFIHRSYPQKSIRALLRYEQTWQQLD